MLNQQANDIKTRLNFAAEYIGVVDAAMRVNDARLAQQALDILRDQVNVALTQAQALFASLGSTPETR